MTVNAKHHATLRRCSLVALAALAAALGGCGGAKGPYHGVSYPAPAEGEQSAAGPGGGDAPKARAQGYDSPPPPAAQPSFSRDGATPGAAPAEAGGYREEADARAGAPAKSSASSTDDPFTLQPQPELRPGLATTWGEARASRVTTAPFVRADQLQPFALAKVFYNDPQGLAAMSAEAGYRDARSMFDVGGGHVQIGLRGEDGRFLTGFTAAGNDYVAGRAGHRYSIYVRNQGPGRIEVVVTVDGLDVIDGKGGSLSKRGYLLDPYGDVDIDGFRTSTSEVAAFRFGSVESSYAARKHGDTRNVGVIGVAAFHERGDSPRFWGPPRSSAEADQRHNADPFPQRYASPPP
jgi:hypothetical protein